MNKQISAIAMLGVAVLASGCGGGGGQSSLPAPANSGGGTTAGVAKATLTIKIPARASNVASAKRSPKYVSASTTELAIRVGTAATVGTAAWQIFNVGANAPASPNVTCSTDSASGVRTCVMTVTAPADPGTVDEFQITATDSATAATDTIPTGNFLSTGDTPQTVTAGAANPVNVSLTPVIGRLAAGAPSYSVWAAPGATATVVAGITASDIDGNVIFGQPAAFANPLTFADGLTPSPFTYPGATPPGLPPPETPGPVLATISYLAPTVGAAGIGATVTVGTNEPDYLPPPTTPPSTTFAIDSMVVSVTGAPIGSLANLAAGTQTLVTVSEPGATSFKVSDNATTTVTLLNSTGTAPMLPGNSIAATNGSASFIVSAVGATPASAAATVTITDEKGTVATLPLVIT